MSLSDLVQSAFLRLHQRVYMATGGRLGHRMAGVATLLLHTKGRKTGMPRTVALVYAVDGSDYVVVASNGGSDTPPGWLANVKADPNVQVQVATKAAQSVATVIEKGALDYATLWELVNANNRQRYEAYQRKTPRPIAMVRLTPTP